MRTSRFDLTTLINLLCHSENDPEVRKYFGKQMSNVRRDEYYGWLELKPEGVEVVFNEVPCVMPSGKFVDPKELYLIAFHLHRDGHEGYARYAGNLPNGVTFGDSESEVVRKLGEPLERGGGNIFPVLNRPVPNWSRYAVGDAALRFQFDQNRRLEMATVQQNNVRIIPPKKQEPQ